MSKFQSLYESIINKVDDSSDYEDTLSTLNKEEIEKFLKSADLSYNSVNYNTFGDIVIKTDDPMKVHDILIGVEQLEGNDIELNSSDNEIVIKTYKED